MAETEGYKEDVLKVPNHDASIPSSDNKYEIPWAIGDSGSGIDGVDGGGDVPSIGSPGPTTQFDVPVTLAENDFPRQTGHDSLASEDALLT